MSSNQNNGQPFSFLEFNEVLNRQYVPQESDSKNNFFAPNQGQKLKFEPNMNVARIQGVDQPQSSQIQKNDQEKKVDLIQDIAKNFKGEQSLIAKTEKNESNDKSNKKSTLPPKKYTINDDESTNNNIPQTEKKQKKKVPPEEYGIENAIKNIKSKEPDAYIPVLLPFTSGDDPTKETCRDEIIDGKDSSNKINFNEENLFLFQFPRQIPLKVDLQEKEKLEETLNEEPSFDQNGYLIKPEFKNVFREIPKNTKLGKLKVYKSGKVKMQIGDVLFDVIPGINTKFVQQASVITGEEYNQAYLLGNVTNKKLVVIPELN